MKLGKNKQQKNLGPSIDATLDQVLTQKAPNLGPSFDSTAYIYISMALDRFAAYILAKCAQFYRKKCPPKSVVETVPKMHFLLSLNRLLSPPKRENGLSARKSRQQTGLKAYVCVSIHMPLALSLFLSFALPRILLLRPRAGT